VFETLFKYPRVVARHRTGRSAEARERFLKHCVSQGLAGATLLRHAREFLVIAERIDITSGETIGSPAVEAAADLRREFDLARSKPRHLAPQPKAPIVSLRAGLGGVMDAFLSAQHVLEMFRRALPNGASRSCLDRLSNRLTKIVAEARKLATP